jgi:hypothetical protein
MSSLYFEKPVSLKTLMDEADKSIERAKLNLKLINLVLGATEKFNDKKLTRRFSKYIASLPELANYTVYYDANVSFQAIKIMGPGIEQGCSFSALICYNYNPTINLEFVRENNRCYTLEEGRIPVMEEGKSKLEDLCIRYNNLLKEAKAIHDESEGLGIRHLFKL